MSTHLLCSSSSVVREPDLNLPQLLHLRLAQPAAVLSSPVGLEVYLGRKDRGDLDMPTRPFLAQEVLPPEVLPQAVVVRIVVLPLPQSLAHMTPLVDAAQVVEEGVVVEETVIAKLAERVALVRRVLGVPIPPVGGQVLAGVGLMLPGKQL